MSIACFITHPEVVVEATTPVPQWHLSDKSIHRMRAFASQADLGNLSAVWASTEPKPSKRLVSWLAASAFLFTFIVGCMRMTAGRPGFCRLRSLTGWRMPSTDDVALAEMLDG